MTDDVSRGTPPAPAAAQGVFGSGGLPLAQHYAELLSSTGVERGLIGPREVSRLWDRHLLNCGVLAEAVPQGASLVDVGSGAGLPGLALAIARPDVRITLVEPLLRRSTFLEEAVAELGLDHCRVWRARAEELHGRATYDVVTSRAVAPLEKLLRWSMPLVSPHGALVAMKGARVHQEVAAARRTLRRLGCGEPEVCQLGSGLVDPPTTVVRVAWADSRQVG